MSVNPTQDSFSRGEISPRLHARAKLELYQSALSKCENFITLPHGGIRKRGGSYFVEEVADSSQLARIIRFVFSDDQAYALVLGHLTMRIYAYGARVGSFTVTTPWDQSHIFGIELIQSADDMWLVHESYTPRKLTRLAHTSWLLEEVPFTDGPFGPVSTDDTLTMYIDAATGSTTIHANGSVFSSAMIGRLIRIDMQTYTAVKPWESYAVIDQPTVNTRRRYEGRVYQTPSVYNDVSLTIKTGATPPTHDEGTEWDGTNGTDVLASERDIVTGLQWTYLHSGYGVARITGFTDSLTVTVTVLSTFPDETVGIANASKIWKLGAFNVGSYPDSVSIFEERLVFGQRFSAYASKSSDFANFTAGEKGDDALVFQNAGGGQANDIVWLMDIDGYLAIGTIGGIRSLSGSGIDEALTPTSFKNKKSKTIACASIAPVQAGQSVVYVGKGGKKLVELKLGQQLRFESDDLGQISEHIPKNGVVELAFQESPDPILWFPLNNGELGGFTYQPSQEVRGMHRHRLGGSFGATEWGVVESCCVTPGQTGEDDVWLIVKRTINGVTKRYIEIITSAFEYGNIEDAFQVDCGLSRTGAAVASVSGLSHLIFQTVHALVDGKVYKDRTVSAGGGVTLPDGATGETWHVGLPFESGADTLELEVGGKDGSLMGRKKRVTKVILSVFETDLSGLEIASLIKGRWEPARLPSVAPVSETASLYTRNIEIPIDDSWAGQGRIMLRHTNPTPCTIRVMMPSYDSEP